MRQQCITIRDLAEQTGISEPTLKRLRTCNNTNPTLDVLIKLSTALKVSLPELVLVESHNAVIRQDEYIEINEEQSEFIYIFSKDTFNFTKGTKAIFRKYTHESPITKFILNKNGQVFEKINEEKWLFRNEKNENFSINKDAILAYIIKELYEVTYV